MPQTVPDDPSVHNAVNWAVNAQRSLYSLLNALSQAERIVENCDATLAGAKSYLEATASDFRTVENDAVRLIREWEDQ